MKILAIDPGTKKTGWAVLQSEKRAPRLSECGVLFVRGKDLPERLLNIHQGIERLIRRHHPLQVIVERPFAGKNMRDAFTLGAARAVCLLAAAAARARVYDYAPTQVKKAACGTGRASKAFVQRLIQLRLGLREAPPPDAADAVALALCHIQHQ